MYLFYDTETTGFLRKAGTPLDDPTQPHLVQLAAALVGMDGSDIAIINVIIKPIGWASSEGALSIHGIDEVFSKRCGIDEMAAVYIFKQLQAAAQLTIAHNVQFDKGIIDIACARYGIDNDINNEHYCTMLALREQGIKGKLADGYKHFFGKEMKDQHDALGDMRACQALFYALREVANQ